MSQRNKAQKLAAQSKSPDDWANYKILRNQVSNKLKNEKDSWKKRKLDNCDDNPAKLWKNIKGWLQWSSSGSPTQLFHEGTLENKPSKLAEIMNNYFINKVRNILHKIPVPKTDPLKTLKRMMTGRTCQLELRAVHPDEVLDIIKSLKNSKSCGLDNIDTYVIKLIKDEILPSITHIVNLSITTSSFPKVYKIINLYLL